MDKDSGLYIKQAVQEKIILMDKANAKKELGRPDDQILSQASGKGDGVTHLLRSGVDGQASKADTMNRRQAGALKFPREVLSTPRMLKTLHY